MVKHLKLKQCYIPLEDVDFAWELEDVRIAEHMWNVGVSIEDMAAHFKRDPDEVFLLIFDLARNEKIKSRPGGIFGSLDSRRMGRM